MIGEDEIIFSGKYKEFSFNARYGLKNAGGKDAAFALCEIVKKIEPYAYEFSGIDCKKVEAVASKAGKDLPSIAKYIRENRMRKQLEETLSNELLVTAAESYFFSRALANAGVSVLPEASSGLKAESEIVEGQIVFIGKYKEWVGIKKLALEGAEDWEVSGILCNAVETAIRKAFQFCGENEEISVSGKRKSFGNAADLLDELAGKMGNDKTKNSYIVVKSLEALGYAPYANAGMLTAAHPELKPKKPKGRIAKG
ncbi:hypothetical protein H0O02_03990 [Candidatus Micrarchaeota archaeon]|nr:hypothetical protein [Candidatus Micrarchaeota archaeon]